ncbi:MAG: substrate-binding periplasmic protein [Desulfococcaceae bacterium]
MISSRQAILILCSAFIFISSAVAGDKVFKIHCDSTPPFIYWTDDNHTAVTGLWAETVSSVMRIMGEKHEPFQIFPWGRLLEMGLKGEFDGIFSATMNEERKKVMWYPKEPLMVEPWIFWIRKSDADKLKFTSYEDLKGHRIGLVKDYTYTPELWEFVKKENNYEEVVHDPLNFRKLVKGRLDYVVSSVNFGAYIAKEEGITDLVHPLTEKPVVDSRFYIIFSKQKVSEEWVNRFSGHLAAFKQTQEYRNLLKKFGVRDELK